MILLYMQCLSNGTPASDHPIIITIPGMDGFYLAFPRKPCLCDHLIKHLSSIGRMEGGLKINSSLFQIHRIQLYNMNAYREKVIWTKACKNHPSSQM